MYSMRNTSRAELKSPLFHKYFLKTLCGALERAGCDDAIFLKKAALPRFAFKDFFNFFFGLFM